MSTRPPSEPTDGIHIAAAEWMARRDRGLRAGEQDEYLDWLRRDPRHGQAMAKLDATWRRLDVLAEWKPRHATQPNPDLLAPARRWRQYMRPSVYAALALAAVIAVIAIVNRPRDDKSAGGPVAAQNGIKVLPGPERLLLADGSVVELNAGGRIQAAFTPGERRVRLMAGEAHFAVAKNPARPFIVEAGAVSVRAVGTAFDVRRAAAEVEVLVTEGKVHLEGSLPAVAEPTPLVAGQKAVVDLLKPTAAPVITGVSGTEIADALAWQGVRLEFADAPLADVVTEFNLRNNRQLIIGDVATGRLRLGGTFRADNVDGFIRLLTATMGVKADYRDDGSIVLRRDL